ncbi:hypothetical protein EJB05_53097, partial [Eragrostis curvula]
DAAGVLHREKKLSTLRICHELLPKYCFYQALFNYVRTKFDRCASQVAEARWLMAPTSNGVEGPSRDAVVEGDGTFRAKQEMATATITGQGGQGMMPMTTTDSRPTNPGNSPGIGNKGKINN